MDQVYRPGYGHLAAALAPCWPAHDLCLYGMDILAALWSVLYLQPERTPGLVSAQAEYQARILPALAAQLAAETTRCGHPRTPAPCFPEHAMTNPVLRRALACAARGWPVFPCQPGAKTPATAHGYRDATTESSRSPTGSPVTRAGTWPSPPAPPAPTSWTSTSTAPPATASAPPPGSATPGCSTAPPPGSAPPAAACTFTSPAPPSAAATCPAATWTSGPQAGTSWPRPPRSAAIPTGAWPPAARPALDWAAVTALLQPQRQPRLPQPRQGQAPGRDPGHLARWVAAQPEGNRNAGLFWAANRALEADPAADLSPLAAAARQAGLPDAEITRTLDSARRTSQPRPRQPDHQAEVN